MAVADIMYGPVTLFYAPAGTAAPADTVEVGGAWPEGWEKFGFTKESLKSNYDFEELEIEVEEALSAVKRIRTKESLTLETVLAEITGANLSVATNGNLTTTSPGVGKVGKEEVTVGGDQALQELAWGFEGTFFKDDGTSFPVRLFVHKGTAKPNGEIEQGKAVSPGIGIQVKALADTTKPAKEQLFKWQKVTAAATS